MNNEYLETIGSFTPEQRLRFYTSLAHFLTVQMRGILFFEGLEDAERVDRAKWLNEIAHRITLMAFYLQINRSNWTEADIQKMIQQNIEKNPAIEEAVNNALELTFEFIKNHENSTDDYEVNT